jgi:hypothetical protein
VKKAKKKKSILPQIIGLIVLLLLLVGASAVVILMATGTVDVEVIAKKKGNPVSEMVDAEKICNRQVRTDYTGRLNSIAHNERSGRYDKPTGNFKLFYQLEIYRDESKQTGTKVVYVTCNIASADGVIFQMEYLDDSEEKIEALRRDDTNIFGF